MSDISDRLLSIVCRLGANCNRPNCVFQHFQESTRGEAIDRHKGTVMEIQRDDYFGHYLKNLTMSALIIPELNKPSAMQTTSAANVSLNFGEDRNVLLGKRNESGLPLPSASGLTVEDKKVVPAKHLSAAIELAKVGQAFEQEKEPNAKNKILKRLGETEFFDLQDAKKAKIKANPLLPSLSDRKNEKIVGVQPEPSVSLRFSKEETSSSVPSNVEVTEIYQKDAKKEMKSFDSCFDREKAKTVNCLKYVNENHSSMLSKGISVGVDHMPSEAIVETKQSKNSLSKRGRKIDSDNEDTFKDSFFKDSVEMDTKQVIGKPDALAKVGEKKKGSFRVASKMLASDDKRISVVDLSDTEVAKNDRLLDVSAQKLPIWRTTGVISLSSKIQKHVKEQSGKAKAFHLNSKGLKLKHREARKEKNSVKVNLYQTPFQPRLVDEKQSASSNEWPLQAKKPYVNLSKKTVTATEWLKKIDHDHLSSTKKFNSVSLSKSVEQKENPSISGCLPINSKKKMINYKNRQRVVEMLLQAYLSVSTSNENQKKEKARQDEYYILERSSTTEAYYVALDDRIKQITEATGVSLQK